MYRYICIYIYIHEYLTVVLIPEMIITRLELNVILRPGLRPIVVCSSPPNHFDDRK